MPSLAAGCRQVQEAGQLFNVLLIRQKLSAACALPLCNLPNTVTCWCLSRYGIEVEPEKWDQWQGNLLLELQHQPHMLPEDQEMLQDKLGTELAQAAVVAAAAARAPRRAAAAAATAGPAAPAAEGAVWLVPGGPGHLPPSIQRILSSVAAGIELSPKDASELLYHAQQLEFASPLQYTPPGIPRAASHAVVDGAVPPDCLPGARCPEWRWHPLWGAAVLPNSALCGPSHPPTCLIPSVPRAPLLNAAGSLYLVDKSLAKDFKIDGYTYSGVPKKSTKAGDLTAVQH